MLSVPRFPSFYSILSISNNKLNKITNISPTTLKQKPWTQSKAQLTPSLKASSYNHRCWPEENTYFFKISWNCVKLWKEVCNAPKFLTRKSEHRTQHDDPKGNTSQLTPKFKLNIFTEDQLLLYPSFIRDQSNSFQFITIFAAVFRTLIKIGKDGVKGQDIRGVPEMT